MDGRQVFVSSVDERRRPFMLNHIQPKLTASELLDLVASHLSLKEKEFFGLCYLDESGCTCWLAPEKKVLDQNPPRNKAGAIHLQIQVKFVESIIFLRDNVAVELFYEQAKSLLFAGVIEGSSDVIFELAAYTLQIYYGDYLTDEQAREKLKKLPVIPTSILRLHPSLPYCEGCILEHYRSCAGYTKGDAIVRYMSIIETLPTYGKHYFEVKNKAGIPWWLGFSREGIGQYDHADRGTPREFYPWTQLENLYYKDRKLCVEVRNPHCRKPPHSLSANSIYQAAMNDEYADGIVEALLSDPSTQVSTRRRAMGSCRTVTFMWYSQPSVVKAMWLMAVAQHKYYLDRKTVRKLPIARSRSAIALELCGSEGSIGSRTNSFDSRTNSFAASDSNSLGSLPGVSDTSSIAARKEICEMLRGRNERLKDLLLDKYLELRAVCISEAEVTGCLPDEFPDIPGLPLPQIKRRIATGFVLPEIVVCAREQTANRNSELSVIEGEYALQHQIVCASAKLARETVKNRKVRKSRQRQYQLSFAKLKEIERSLKLLRLGNNSPDRPVTYAGESDGGTLLADRRSLPRSSSSPPALRIPPIDLPYPPPHSPLDLRYSNHAVSTSHIHSRHSTNYPQSSRAQSALHIDSPPYRSSGSLNRESLEDDDSLIEELSHVSLSTPNTPLLQRADLQTATLASPSYSGYKANPTFQTRYRSQRYPTLNSYSRSSGRNRFKVLDFGEAEASSIPSSTSQAFRHDPSSHGKPSAHSSADSGVQCSSGSWRSSLDRHGSVASSSGSSGLLACALCYMGDSLTEGCRQPAGDKSLA